jgi:hypothetical protein
MRKHPCRQARSGPQRDLCEGGILGISGRRIRPGCQNAKGCILWRIGGFPHAQYRPNRITGLEEFLQIAYEILDLECQANRLFGD